MLKLASGSNIRRRTFSPKAVYVWNPDFADLVHPTTPSKMRASFQSQVYGKGLQADDDLMRAPKVTASLQARARALLELQTSSPARQAWSPKAGQGVINLSEKCELIYEDAVIVA
jgi:hypothetical protein